MNSGGVQGAGHAQFDRADAPLGVLGAPARAGAAHVMKLGPVGVEQVLGEGVPECRGGPAEARSLAAGLGHDELPNAIDRRPRPAPWSRGRAAGVTAMVGADSLKTGENSFRT